VWHTPDTPDNAAELAKPDPQHWETVNPLVRMLCQMELTSHLYVQAVIDSYVVNEMVLAKKPIERTPKHSFTQLDKGF
jgi:hypothetical protein